MSQSLITVEQRARLDAQVKRIKLQKAKVTAALLKQFQDTDLKSYTDYEVSAMDAVTNLLSGLDPCQLKAMQLIEKHRTVGFVSGRRVGKSFFLGSFIAMRMLMNSNINCAISAPTLTDARQIHFDGEAPNSGLLKMIPPSLIHHVSRADPSIILKNGSRCDFLGATKPEKGRGHGYRVVGFDEVNFFPSWRYVENMLLAVSAADEAGYAEGSLVYNHSSILSNILTTQRACW